MAGAPVTDWSLYDAIWTERYLDHPDSNPTGYASSSPLRSVDRLATPLLLVHGLADDNVHPENSKAFLSAAVRAGLPVRSLFYPGEKHGLRDPARLDFFLQMTRFFDRVLRPDSGLP